ncbi:peptidoglycan glycosyltransferase FtsW [Pseudopelagicola sp. nBUS_19]|uniref:peptidoglycan glycosyltransferase FtsW n=1 Tax=Pseudopelagicola sp. nBUS_19 TaxID=3395316 RepID=UPI003EC15105
MTEMVYGALPIQEREPLLPRWWQTLDKWSMTSIFLLFGIGILLGMAASPPLAEKNGFDAFYYVEKQFIFGAVAMIVMLLTSMMSPQLVRRLAVIGFFVALLATSMLPFFGTDFGKGAMRWYSLGFGSVQPSEFLKPGFVIVAAWLMAANDQINGPPGRMWSFLLMITIVVMLALQPDFGQACLILFGWSVMYFVSGAPMFLIGGILLAIYPAAQLAYDKSEHFARRIDGFLDRSLDPTTQIGYATKAIREGGLFGVGIGGGQVKWSLPDAHTDFIISVAAEEYGLILVICIIALYATIVMRSYFRLMRERDPFIRLAGAGLISIFGVQAMVNMGVAVRLLPSKGMTLPFVSYGGSSLIAGGIAVGMLLAFTRARPQGEIGEILRGHVR